MTLPLESDSTSDADTKVIIQVEPSIDPSLAFAIHLPAGWARVDGWHAELCRLGLPVPLAVFACADARDLVVAVSAEQLPAEVDVIDWCRFRCVHGGWLVTSTRELPDVGGCELIARSSNGWTRRDRVVQDGARLVHTHVLNWEKPGHDERSPLQASLHLLRPALGDRVERWVDAVLGRELTFALPESWRCTLPRHDEAVASVDAELLTHRGMMAVLGVRARPRAQRPRALIERLASVRTELGRWGFDVGERAETDQPRERTLRGIAGWRGGFVLGPAQLADVVFDVRCWHVDVGAREVDAWVVVAWADETRLEWMRAIRALEIAVTSLRSRCRPIQ